MQGLCTRKIPLDPARYPANRGTGQNPFDDERVRQADNEAGSFTKASNK